MSLLPILASISAYCDPFDHVAPKSVEFFSFPFFFQLFLFYPIFEKVEKKNVESCAHCEVGEAIKLEGKMV